MPLIEEQEISQGTGDWCGNDCPKDVNNNYGQIDWNLRHNLLHQASGQAWIGIEQGSYDWLGSDSIDPELCILLQDENVLHSGPVLSGPMEYPNTKEIRVLATRVRADELRVEFEALTKKWLRETRHLSLVARKITHPAYLRIIGMGEAAIPLILEALRDKPAHWFVALRATTNLDPSHLDDSPLEARDAWIGWGIKEGYID